MKRATQSGFTILELLLAVAVAGGLMVAATFQIVSFSNIWAHRAEDDTFSEHADGVTRFLATTLERAIQPKSAGYSPTRSNLPNGGDDRRRQQEEEGEDLQQQDQQDYDDQYGGTTSVTNGIELSRPPGMSGAEAPLIHFGLSQPPPFLNEAQLPGLPAAEVFLRFQEGQGLALLWYSPLTENVQDLRDDSIRSMLLSPYVSAIDYYYRDDSTHNWEEKDELDKRGGDYLMPEFIRLTFTLGDRNLYRMLRIPKAAQQIPLF